jgi:hypothetical protein
MAIRNCFFTSTSENPPDFQFGFAKLYSQTRNEVIHKHVVFH